MNKRNWHFLAILSLTIGLAVGEMNLRSSDSNQGSVSATKFSHNFETDSFSFSDSYKLGVRRSPYRFTTLNAADADPLALQEDETKTGLKAVCLETDDLQGEAATYTATITEVKMSDAIQPGEEFRVEIYVENTGNVTWFGANSHCPDKTIVNLGTFNEQDRASRFFYRGTDQGWLGTNRIQMIEDSVRPGETAIFAFNSIAPADESIYREYFNLVAEGVSWFVDTEFPMDVRVGTATEDDEYKLQFMKSVSTDTRSVTGDKSIEVDLSEQTMMLKFGDQAVYTLRVSTGKSNTPTPTGNWKILSKQELRIGGESPHYRMPYFQQFTSYGHGLHALPYLASDGGTFWEEALSHIGVPVSHGCIRMLPDDAVVVYNFGEVGTPLNIYR
ncbi:MAG: L,D-transpeptidase family protein [Candidatus Gracilibacteria bacterium]